MKSLGCKEKRHEMWKVFTVSFLHPNTHMHTHMHLKMEVDDGLTAVIHQASERELPKERERDRERERERKAGGTAKKSALELVRLCSC